MWNTIAIVGAVLVQVWFLEERYPREIVFLTAGLIIALMLINLPIIVWMLYTYFKEIPGEILEAAPRLVVGTVTVGAHA